MFGISRWLSGAAGFIAWFLFVGIVVAQPPLTTIQDTIYKADGSRFNGLALISWKGFSAPDGSNIGANSIAANIVNGVIRVQLAPSTNASAGAGYTVTYNSDGRYQFTEFWAVPPSSAALRISDVRVASLSSSGGGGTVTGTPPPGLGQLQIADISNLANELSLRPLKGIGYAASRTAVIDMTGTMTAAVGNLSDCVRVDGSSGPCGSGISSAAGFVDGETPAGSIDGVNAAYTLANSPNPAASLDLYRNGVLMKQALDYTLSGGTINFQTFSMPQPGDILLASYRLAASGALAAGLTSPGGPEIVCNNNGQTSSATTLTTLGSCVLAPNLLRPGDRVEIRLDYLHTGSSVGFTMETHWGGSTILSRSVAANELFATLKADAGVHTAGAQWSVQTWGTVHTISASAGFASDALTSTITLDFLGQMASSTLDTITLSNYTVIRYPAQ